ncbi:14-3-3 protein, putative [Plasmodium gallinaceum]|uniref:14-3-3 protein, putative n=1 Tax=Plasmodium gallinaceum TaxID=5849 RepID=A0A1J1GNF8_PLAGA|nr:14-3-3 protein, putative [Plasmodium gallinaceum]CRG93978.1 14-3-3 protein, putative [Plasmodium gallinaceum]
MKTNINSKNVLPNKDEFIYCLKMLDNLGFYDEMVASIKSVNVENYNLNYKESLLMGSAFKNALNVKRKEKTIVENIMSNEKSSEKEKVCAELLKSKLNKDIRTIEKNAYIIIKTKCIPRTTDDKVLLFYWHLLGDIFRYCADTFNKEEKKKLHEKSLQSYSFALRIANKMKVFSSSPIMLELLVSLSVLHKDMDKDINFAIEMAAQAFRNAIQNMHLLENDDECSKTIGILGLLRDNINKWCEISGRKNVNALFEIKGENFDKYKNIMNSIHT